MLRYLVIFLLLSCTAVGQSSMLKVAFKNIPSNKGSLKLQVLNEKEEVVKKASIIGLQRSGDYIYSVDLPEGKYAVQAFHDENDNGDIDKNMLGIPVEAYGFSNNVRGVLGPPEIKDQLVEVTGTTEISIYLD